MRAAIENLSFIQGSAPVWGFWVSRKLISSPISEVTGKLD